ncbi:hypothetical protein [Spirochaeta lutea]|nr:hypothetical protein [Spirochaeta lutea]
MVLSIIALIASLSIAYAQDPINEFNAETMATVIKTSGFLDHYEEILVGLEITSDISKWENITYRSGSLNTPANVNAFHASEEEKLFVDAFEYGEYAFLLLYQNIDNSKIIQDSIIRLIPKKNYRVSKFPIEHDDGYNWGTFLECIINPDNYYEPEVIAIYIINFEKKEFEEIEYDNVKIIREI